MINMLEGEDAICDNTETVGERRIAIDMDEMCIKV